MYVKNFLFLLSFICALLGSLPLLAADVEIIDGTDTETMKALFPSLKNKYLSALEKMHKNRLDYEAQCTENTKEKFLARRANFYHLQALIRYQCPR